MHSSLPPSSTEANPCLACGACCSFSSTWPRFTTDSDEDIAVIPRAFVAADDGGMHCVGDRCSALDGTVGSATSCGIYGVRPDVCRSCMPGDEACNIARAKFQMPLLGSGTTPE